VIRSALRPGLLLGLFATLGLLVLTACQIGAPSLLPGRIAWPKDGDLWVINLGTKDQKKVTDLPRSAAVTGVAWSPDGTQLLYAQFWRPPNAKASGADLFQSNADGSDAHVFAQRDVDSTVLESPTWLPSGNIYYTVRAVQGNRETQTIVRSAGEGTPPTTVVDKGYYPSISPDESTIVFVRTTQNGMELRKRTLNDTGDGCVLVPDTIFAALDQPRISPDGKRVAFGGSGDPSGQPGTCGGSALGPPPAGTSGNGGEDVAPLLALGQWFGVVATPAYAHGLPYDIWTMSLDGGQLTKVADVKEDEPTVSWSPDGSHLAIFGVAALYMADASGSTTSTQKVVEQGGYGGLDWTKP
jgi:Tol biopolymer transport system component